MVAKGLPCPHADTAKEMAREAGIEPTEVRRTLRGALYFSREVGGGEAGPATLNRPEAVPGVTGQSLSIGGRDEQEERGIAWG